MPSALSQFLYAIHIPVCNGKQKRVQLSLYNTFSRFVKATKAEISPDRQLIMEFADILVISSGDSFEEKSSLFETAGFLVQSSAQLDSLINPLNAALNESMLSRVNSLNAQNSILIEASISNYIMSVGAISTGLYEAKFPSVSASLYEHITTVLKIIESFPSTPIFRSSAIYLFQRLMNLMQLEILPLLKQLVLLFLMHNSDLKEMVDFLHFYSSSIHKLKPAIVNVLDETISALFERIFSLISTTNVDGTDAAISIKSLLKEYLSFLSAIFTAKLQDVLRSNRNFQLFLPLLQSIVQCFLTSPTSPIKINDAQIMKSACTLLSKIIQTWCPSLNPIASQPESIAVHADLKDSHGTIPNLHTFFYSQFFQICYQTPCNSSFLLSDGQSLLLLNELVTIHKLLLDKRQMEFMSFLSDLYKTWPYQLHEPCVHFVNALSSGDVKLARKAFLSIIELLKKSTSE